MNMHMPQAQRTPAETALIDAFGERLSLLPGDGAVMLKRDDAIEALKSRPADAARRSLALYGSAPPADGGAGASTRRQRRQAGRAAGRRLDRAAAAERRLEPQGTPSIEGVTVQRLEEKLQDGSFAPALEPRGADDAIGAHQYRLRRRRLFRRHRGRRRARRSRSNCRTCRPAARPMCACRSASATAPRRPSSSARPAAARRWSARSAICCSARVPRSTG